MDDEPFDWYYCPISEARFDHTEENDHIDFVDSAASPSWTVVWNGTFILFRSEPVTFRVRFDQWIELYIDGSPVLVVDKTNGVPKVGTVEVELSEGLHDIQFILHDDLGLSAPIVGLSFATLEWSSATIPLSPIGPAELPVSPPSLCLAEVRPDCRTAEKGSFLLTQEGGDRDKLIWKWGSGQATSQAEYGDPISSTDYALCLYAGTTAALVAEASVAPDSTSWKALSTKGFKYKDSTASEGGVQTMLLKGSNQDKAKVLVKGKGASLPDPTLPFGLPLTARLVNDDTGICWESTFETSGVTTNEPDQFKAKK